MDELIVQLGAYAQRHSLPRKALAEKLGIPYTTLAHWFSQGKRHRNPSKHNRVKLEVFLGKQKPLLEDPALLRDAKKRTDRAKWLLLLLATELEWFRDGQPAGRRVFREQLDPFDIGYITSLLTMLADEDKFQRWRALTTNRFNSFRRRPAKNPQDS